MTSQILALHRVSARKFDLSGVRTGNVRDQLLRSTLVVEALHKEGLIGKGNNLLVYGGGAAGVNAAIQAAKHRTNVVIVEIEDDLFSTLVQAAWRRIDPTEYDWPLSHWKDGRFPLNSTMGITLRQKTADGPALAAAWQAKWDEWFQKFDGVGINGRVELVKENARNFQIQEVQGGVDVTGPWTSGPRSTRNFSAVLSCIGFGDEQVSEIPNLGKWNGYAGPQFWLDNDGLASNVPLPNGVSSAIVSGGGDGAMQDVQRLATSKFGRELYEELGRAHKANGGHILPDDAALRRMQEAEDKGRRAFAWALQRGVVPQAQKAWHDAFAAEARAVRGWPPNVQLDVANKLLRQDVLDNALKISWLYRDETPAYAYALNRYLSCLLIELAKAINRAIDVYAQHEIESITPVGHQCANVAGCLGSNHEVWLKPLAAGHTSTQIKGANFIVIRHGVEPRPVLLGGPPAPEQMVPYDLPH